MAFVEYISQHPSGEALHISTYGDKTQNDQKFGYE